MSDQKKRPVATIGIRRKEGDQWRSYSVIVVWGTDYDGLYNGNIDKGSDKRPAMGPIDAIKALAAGASLEIRMNTGNRAAAPTRTDRAPVDDFGGGGGGFDDVPFARVDERCV